MNPKEQLVESLNQQLCKCLSSVPMNPFAHVPMRFFRHAWIEMRVRKQLSDPDTKPKQWIVNDLRELNTIRSLP